MSEIEEGLVVSDEVEPTEEEIETLRRIPDRVSVAAYLIAFCELAERFSYYGCVQVFQNFIQYPRPSLTGAGHKGQSGALGKGQAVATAVTTFNSFWVYCMPLVGAFFADSMWGRYKTICIAAGIAIFGHVLLVISGIPPVLNNVDGAFGLFLVAIVIMGLGTGSFKSSISPLIAEQVKNQKMHVRTLESGDRVIVDPILTVARLFMYFYLFINVGAIAGQLGMSFSEKTLGYWFAFMLPTIIMCLTIPVLLFGRNRYVRTPPAGWILGDVFRFWRLAARGRWSCNPCAMWRNFHDDDFWEGAKPSMYAPEERPEWMKPYDDIFVAEIDRGLKACTCFLYYPPYWLCYNQMTNNLTSQASTMQLDGLPNEITSNLDPFALIVFIPIMDLWVYPLFRYVGISFTPLKRVCAGFFFASTAMVWACALQYYIYKMSACGDYATDTCDAPINVWAQTGSYVLIGLSEIFASITGLEYAYSKAPQSMRSLVMAIYLFTTAVGSAISEAFNALAENPRLIWNYGVFAVISFITGIAFWIQFRAIDAMEDELNKISVEREETEKERRMSHAKDQASLALSFLGGSEAEEQDPVE